MKQCRFHAQCLNSHTQNRTRVTQARHRSLRNALEPSTLLRQARSGLQPAASTPNRSILRPEGSKIKKGKLVLNGTGYLLGPRAIGQVCGAGGWNTGPGSPRGKGTGDSPIFWLKILSNVSSSLSSRYFCITLRMLREREGEKERGRETTSLYCGQTSTSYTTHRNKYSTHYNH